MNMQSPAGGLVPANHKVNTPPVISVVLMAVQEFLRGELVGPGGWTYWNTQYALWVTTLLAHTLGSTLLILAFKPPAQAVQRRASRVAVGRSSKFRASKLAPPDSTPSADPSPTATPRGRDTPSPTSDQAASDTDTRDTSPIRRSSCTSNGSPVPSRIETA